MQVVVELQLMQYRTLQMILLQPPELTAYPVLQEVQSPAAGEEQISQLVSLQIGEQSSPLSARLKFVSHPAHTVRVVHVAQLETAFREQLMTHSPYLTS